MSATLGVATISYAPFAFFNLFCPVIAIIYGFANVALKPVEADADNALTGQA
jgi:NhaC family Na+:H+ antiporter